MRLIVGLGNPGEKYRRTRHNVGFMVVDALAVEWGGAHWYEQADALAAEIEIEGQPVVLAKPQTFMNRSGLAVAELVAAHGLNPPDVFVIVDDVAIELGTLRIRERGGHGGHNGLRSVIDSLESEDFPRLRIGVKRGDLAGDLADYVLAPFPDEDVLVVQELVGTAVEAVAWAVREGTASAMSRYNGPLKPT
jgi:peptidyl-tRNA hydrolase, PTH1 family